LAQEELELHCPVETGVILYFQPLLPLAVAAVDIIQTSVVPTAVLAAVVEVIH
jgi:hypothetical protein